ncbi:MAG: peptidase M28 [Candidatus Hydrogenedentota bacterium]|nr:MAG: peptidase M28 [Candidatus Hydrogenedentota bacterium]GIX45182.1 MAG: protease HtpX [Candidatus Sumerlaea sp.]
MWEQIRSNRRRSVVLTLLMFVLFAGTSAALGFAIVPNEDGMHIGLGIGTLVFLILYLIYAGSPTAVVFANMDARKLSREDLPILHNVVEEISIAAGLPKVPDVYIINEWAPNAFAFGRSPEKAGIAVTAGLLDLLTRDELQGVVAHEVAHIKNQDTRFMTLMAVMLGAIVVMADLTWRLVRFQSVSSNRDRDRKQGNQAVTIALLIALLVSLLAPILARIIYFASSRRREYLADACAAVYTRYPEGLASALEKIEAQAAEMTAVNRAAAPMFIINPLAVEGADSIFATHPPTEKRIEILRCMAGGTFTAYEQAARSVIGRSVLHRSALMRESQMHSESPRA